MRSEIVFLFFKNGPIWFISRLQTGGFQTSFIIINIIVVDYFSDHYPPVEYRIFSNVIFRAIIDVS